jgi:hypothetical protein
MKRTLPTRHILAILVVALLVATVGGQSSSARVAQQPCDWLWPAPSFAGFPAEVEVGEDGMPIPGGRTDNPGLCVPVPVVEADDVEVYFPGSVLVDPALQNLYSRAFGEAIGPAIRRSVRVYNGLQPGKQVGEVAVIFVDTLQLSLRPSRRAQDTPFAATRNRNFPYLSRVKLSPCPVIVYTPKILAARGNVRAVLQQVVAHELFHCYQAENYWNQYWFSTSDWWVEPTAEYFSNVVYPRTNFEWRWTDELRLREPERDLVQLSSENFLFFQFLGRRDGSGNRSILNLIGSLPTEAGPERQLDALARFTGIQDPFHRFARAYLDTAVEDTGGGEIKVNARILRRIPISANFHTTVRSERFRITRARLVFATGKRYFLRVTPHGTGRSAWRQFAKPGVWGPLPTQLTLTPPCGQPIDYLLLLTTISHGYSITISVPRVEDNPACAQGPPQLAPGSTPTAHEREFRNSGCGRWVGYFPRLRRLPRAIHVRAQCHGDLVLVKYIAGCMLAFPKWSRRDCEFYRYAWAQEWWAWCPGSRGRETLGANPSVEFWVKLDPCRSG